MTERARTAWKLRRFVRSRGYGPSFKLCYRIVAAARDTKTPVAVLAALVEKESAFKFIFGHDEGGWFQGLQVTEDRYRRLRAHLRTSWTGANGVGYVQVTYPPFITANGHLWKPKANLRWGARHAAGLIDEHGLVSGLNAYNGDPTGAYGRDLAKRVKQYRQALGA